MTNENISMLIKNERLVLNRKEKFNHYSPALMLCLLMIILLIYTIWDKYFSSNSNSVRSLSDMFEVYFFFGLVASLIALVKYRRLKFKEIRGSVTQEDLEEAIKRASKDRSWRLKLKRNRLYQYESRPGFTTNWGMFITIILEKDRILFNNICSLESQSAVSFCIINKDFDIFLSHLNQVRQKKDYSKASEINDTQWNWKMILARLFLYPLCTFFFWLSIFHLIPTGNYVMSIITIAISSTYIFSDLYMIFKRKKTIPKED